MIMMVNGWIRYLVKTTLYIKLKVDHAQAKFDILRLQLDTDGLVSRSPLQSCNRFHPLVSSDSFVLRVFVFRTYTMLVLCKADWVFWFN